MKKNPAFSLKISLGNDAMQSGQGIALALRRIANALENRTAEGLENCASKIWDANGNVVGSWKVL